MAKIAFLFPGQGAQAVGMAAQVVEQVPAARDLFQRASAFLGYDLLEVCVNGPKEKLDATNISQPALYVAGLAAVEALRKDDSKAIEACEAAAGLSLGEYTALVFAGAMTFEDGLAVVKVRGESMQSAAEATASSMVAVLGLEPSRLEMACEQAAPMGRIRIANFLCPGNLVVSGDLAACDEIERLAPEFGAMKTIRLSVAGAFHTEIMRPALEKLAAALEGVPLQTPMMPVISNVDAKAHRDPADIRKILVRQVVEPVLWEPSMRQLMADGFDKFYELGPGRVLAGLMKRIQRKAEVVNVTV